MIGVARDDDGLAVCAFLKSILRLIDTERFAGVFGDSATWFTTSRIRSVAAVASLGENGLDVLVKGNQLSTGFR